MEEMQKRQNHQEKRSMIRTTMEQCGNTSEDIEEPKTPTENIGICRICRCPSNTPRDAERHRETQTNPKHLQKNIGICRICRCPRNTPRAAERHRETQTNPGQLWKTMKTMKTVKTVENCGKL
jgi:hypothetical protein